MSSIRPLVTITLLVVVGVFLYVKINQGPVAPPVPGANDLSQSQLPDGVPPLAATASAPAPYATTAPLWPTTSAPVALATSTDANPANIPGTNTLAHPLADATSTSGDIAAGTPSAVPAIPELPTVPASTDAMAVATTNSVPPITTAGPGAPATAGAPGNVYDVMAPQTNLQAAAPAGVALGGPTAGQTADAGAIDSDPLAFSTTASGSPNPLRQTALPQDLIDGSRASADAANGVKASFAASWAAIRTALDRGDLAQAHQLLSPWHDELSLNPAEAETVDSLLSQLAGTVIYSTEHRLQPARVVKPGESLESIAKEYSVPWQLLAKINGIPAADQVRPGQELKVVPGPFSAVVDLGRSQLTLLVDGRYAGKFPVRVPIGATVREGEWLVDQKLMAPSGGVTQSAYTTEPARVDHAIVLRGDSEAAGTPGGPTLAIASSATPTGPGASPPAIQVSAADAEELTDILSIGSRVVIRR